MLQDQKEEWEEEEEEEEVEEVKVGDKNVKYYVPNKLRHIYSEAEIESFLSQFKVLDEDRSGSLCKSELYSLLG